MKMNKMPKIIINTSEFDDLLLDVINQACGLANGDIDNDCTSAYEIACDYLTDKGYMQTRNGRIYILTKKGKELSGAKNGNV